MRKDLAIKLFENVQVRTAWDDEEEKWYFSIVDVVAVLTDSPNANNYWKVLKHRLAKEGSELVKNCNQLKMLARTGKENIDLTKGRFKKFILYIYLVFIKR